MASSRHRPRAPKPWPPKPKPPKPELPDRNESPKAEISSPWSKLKIEAKPPDEAASRAKKEKMDPTVRATDR